MATVATRKKTKQRRLNSLGIAENIKSFSALREHFHYSMSNSLIKQVVEAYVESNFTPEDSALILSLHDSYFTANTAMAAAIFWKSKGGTFDSPFESYENGVDEFFSRLLEKARQIKEAREEVNKQKEKVVKKSPMQMLSEKVDATIMADIDDVFEAWSEGKIEKDFSLFSAFHSHGLKPATQTLNLIRPTIKRVVSEYSDAISKDCEQAVEAYAHIPLKEKRRRLKVLKQFEEDLNRLAMSKSQTSSKKAKAKTSVRKKKPVDVAKVMSGIKYNPEEVDGIRSLDPMKIYGTSVVYLYNPEKRVLQVLRGGPMTASGASVKGFEKDEARKVSYSIRLRKPHEVLPEILTRSPKQIDKILEKLTTKKGPCTGRTSNDTMILRCVNT